MNMVFVENIVCLADYAALHYENAKTVMMDYGRVRVDVKSLTDTILSGTDGYEELKQCLQNAKMPAKLDWFLLEKVPQSLFVTEQNATFFESFDPRERIVAKRLKQHPMIGKVMKNWLLPSASISEKIGTVLRQLFCKN